MSRSLRHQTGSGRFTRVACQSLCLPSARQLVRCAVPVLHLAFGLLSVSPRLQTLLSLVLVEQHGLLPSTLQRETATTWNTERPKSSFQRHVPSFSNLQVMHIVAFPASVPCSSCTGQQVTTHGLTQVSSPKPRASAVQLQQKGILGLLPERRRRPARDQQLAHREVWPADAFTGPTLASHSRKGSSIKRGAPHVCRLC